jgi:hypothetical protein
MLACKAASGSSAQRSKTTAISALRPLGASRVSTIGKGHHDSRFLGLGDVAVLGTAPQQWQDAHSQQGCLSDALRAVQQSHPREAQEVYEHLCLEIAGAFKFKGDVESASDLAYCEGVFGGYVNYAAVRGNCHWPYTAPGAFPDPFEVGQQAFHGCRL